ncbi:hypothetical protein CONPUDRAFT_168225 [Coniophora puteana RWD-64-598 SS2]|uniref:Uncharacterized protein n=1 Tax=Coniophora puteana (strain RWD-64-598) TaxID=741705 RepID=A0A5M3MEK8_CONPW|nr:uncharacterized protein CONPUDRAFT_168225 [Coniophora puteana RWD-64-598 SS2]EIW77234.1 hypothetical protein CONPUDRAFT_168225 [Coniophora puteana RWD-64-598 SS2]
MVSNSRRSAMYRKSSGWRQRSTASGIRRRSEISLCKVLQVSFRGTKSREMDPSSMLVILPASDNLKVWFKVAEVIARIMEPECDEMEVHTVLRIELSAFRSAFKFQNDIRERIEPKDEEGTSGGSWVALPTKGGSGFPAGTQARTVVEERRALGTQKEGTRGSASPRNAKSRLCDHSCQFSPLFAFADVHPVRAKPSEQVLRDSLYVDRLSGERVDGLGGGTSRG